MTGRRAGLVLLLAAAVAPARAQTIDYSAFEQMFGEPVTTSATGKPQRASEVPAEMEIVTADDIRRSGADNIPDLLRFVPGVEVRRYGTRDASVGIRGYNTSLNPRVMVLVDGRQVYQDDFGDTVWALVPVTLSEIRQIEIVKGPGAALFGFNAVSGVINIITYDPLRDRVNAVRVDAGTQNETYGEATATVQVPGRLGVRLSAAGFRSTEFAGQQAGTQREQPDSGTVAIDGRLQVSPGVEWDLSGSIGSLTNDYNVQSLYLRQAQQANSLRSRLTADTRFGLLSLDVYRNENRTSAPASGSGTIPWREDVEVVQASDVLKLGSDHTIRFVGEFRDNAISSLTAFSGRLAYTDIAGSAMWDWQILPQLSLTNAIRVDRLSLGHTGAQVDIPTVGALYHDRLIVEPSFNSGAVLRLTDADTVRISAARAVQLPSLIDFGLEQANSPVLLAGNSSLQPSAVLNFELDYDRALPALGSVVRLAAFAQQSDRTLGSPTSTIPTLLPTGQLLLMARNFGASKEVGGEIGLKGSSQSGLRWNASYALAAVHDETPEADLAMAPAASYQRETPTHSVVLGGGGTWGRLELDVQGRWQSHFEDTSGTTGLIVVPNYVTVDAHLSYRLTEQVTLSLLAEQLNLHRVTASAGLQVERRFLAGARARF